MTPESLDAAAIREITALTEKTRQIALVTLDNVAGIPGVPDRIMVGIRNGERPEVVDISSAFEGYRERPKRKSGTATVLALASFNALVNRHATPHSVIFAKTDWRKPELLAVIDYHEKAAEMVEGEIGPIDHASPDELDLGVCGTYAPRPDNLRHRVHYAYPLSDDWKIWVEKNG